jgi:two-component system phosphate regulon response regulator PhoB
MSHVILLIHHDALARRFISHVLEQQGGYVVLAATDSDDALHELHRHEPALLPDVLLTGTGQHAAVLASALRRHLSAHRRLPVVVLDEDSDIVTAPVALRVAAEPRELLLKLKAVLRPGPTEQPVLERDGLRLDPAQQAAHIGHLPLTLTPLAFRLLHFLMAHPGRVYSRAQLLDAVWADQGVVEERTVDVHVYRLRSQLERYGSGHLIEAVRGSGYRFAGEVPRKRDGSASGLRFAS